MSTFDASSQPAHAADQDVPPQDVTDPIGDYHASHTDGPAPADYPVDEPLMSTLDQLRASADEEDDREPITVLNPRETIRLTLRTDLEQKEIQRWSNVALDRKVRQKLDRRGGTPNLTKLNPVIMYATAIAETCTGVEVWSRATNTWTEVTDDRTGEPLTFSDPMLRQVLGGIDAVSAVKRAFNNSEPALMTAGQRLIDASGFGDDDELGDDEDPTTATG